LIIEVGVTFLAATSAYTYSNKIICKKLPLQHQRAGLGYLIFLASGRSDASITEN
jgi:hypothetical protein